MPFDCFPSTVCLSTRMYLNDCVKLSSKVQHVRVVYIILPIDRRVFASLLGMRIEDYVLFLHFSTLVDFY